MLITSPVILLCSITICKLYHACLACLSQISTEKVASWRILRLLYTAISFFCAEEFKGGLFAGRPPTSHDRPLFCPLLELFSDLEKFRSICWGLIVGDPVFCVYNWAQTADAIIIHLYTFYFQASHLDFLLNQRRMLSVKLRVCVFKGWFLIEIVVSIRDVIRFKELRHVLPFFLVFICTFLVYFDFDAFWELTDAHFLLLNGISIGRNLNIVWLLKFAIHIFIFILRIKPLQVFVLYTLILVFFSFPSTNERQRTVSIEIKNCWYSLVSSWRILFTTCLADLSRRYEHWLRSSHIWLLRFTWKHHFYYFFIYFYF